MLHQSVNSTFVFFIRHRSHAFHTLLCRPSTITAPWSWVVVLDLFDDRCVDLELESFVFLLTGDLEGSSIGGVGNPDMTLLLVRRLSQDWRNTRVSEWVEDQLPKSKPSQKNKRVIDVEVLVGFGGVAIKEIQRIKYVLSPLRKGSMGGLIMKVGEL